MAQVKFYSVASLPSTADAGGVYFVDGGELYKGRQRFGLGRVTVAESTASIEGAARGDIVVTGSGAGWVFDGTNWQSIGGDTSALQSMWRSDISTWTSALAVGDANSYITSISQAEDGKVTAHAESFGTKVLEAVGNGSATSTANGITVDVVTTSGSVTGVTVSADNLVVTSISASAGTFTDLTVDTANFTATSVAASTLTVGGVAVDNIAASTATSTASGVAVTVSTANGGVKDVDVAVTGNLATFAGKSVVTAIGPATGEGAASDGNIPTEAAVRAALNNFDNAMHFVGAGTTLPASAVAGDVYVFTANATDESGYKSGQEVVYTGSAWEVIGDQNSYALNAYAPGEEVVTASATTLPAATHAIAGKVDELVAQLSDFTYSSVTGGTSSSTVNGVGVEVVTAATTAVPTVTLTGVGTAASQNFATTVTSDGTALPTQSAVAAYVTTAIEGLDASVSSSENASIKVGVTQVDGVVTGVTADLVWLGADGTAL